MTSVTSISAPVSLPSAETPVDNHGIYGGDTSMTDCFPIPDPGDVTIQPFPDPGEMTDCFPIPDPDEVTIQPFPDPGEMTDCFPIPDPDEVTIQPVPNPGEMTDCFPIPDLADIGDAWRHLDPGGPPNITGSDPAFPPSRLPESSDPVPYDAAVPVWHSL